MKVIPVVIHIDKGALIMLFLIEAVAVVIGVWLMSRQMRKDPNVSRGPIVSFWNKVFKFIEIK